ncbi:hypothetical protein BBBOND_0305750 [Babesia bigemina]|uniref:Uncharacterized protein n=1 Tax=Babesia bigemina TaxID=5866 RepID=A0A061D7J2_BABBI|nr:hypothetical protein BBBOND_0305750 [Babesia bigemina]CDR96671.1 hypothetical protein BBBOND_0305750 [Babesia bigemina]|eukprot:XP_012768857.1 hypothetical protein BBBOND_0305750 [Babesia bigemina]
MVYSSLKGIPRDFREGVDWILALKGSHPDVTLGMLADAVHRLLVRHPVGYTEIPALEKVKSVAQKFFEQKSFKHDPFAEMLLKRYNARMPKDPMGLAKSLKFYLESDYRNVIAAHDVRPQRIAGRLRRVADACERFLNDIKSADSYRSTYTSRATWDVSCAKDPETCAAIFVGIAPMLFTGLLYLMEADEYASRVERNYEVEKQLEDLLRSLGYGKPECKDRIDGPLFTVAVRDINDTILDTLYDLAGFWAFY